MMRMLLWCFCLITTYCWAQPSVFTPHDKTSLQRGAAVFMNYCSGCHSLNYLRYNQMAAGLGINSLVVLKNNLIFTQANSSDPITIALPEKEAQQWFGLVPPDLSLSARQRGVPWLYHYLMGFYADKNRPFGTNNIMVPNVAMPDVLEPLRGQWQLVDREQHKPLFKVIQQGTLAPEEFEQTVTDLVNFLDYVGEPTKAERYRLGLLVLLFLTVLLVPLYCLQRLYWKSSRINH